MLDLFPTPEQHAVGGKVSIRVRAEVIGSALFAGPGDCYRYELSRTDTSAPLDAPTFMFLMMNPSTATDAFNDTTVAKCWRLTQAWGGRTMLVGNVHAYRCTDQARLAETSDPFGPDNMHHLLAMARRADQVVVGYGTPRIKALRERGPAVARALIAEGVGLSVLRLSRDGVPVHPLYLPESLLPEPWSPE